MRRLAWLAFVWVCLATVPLPAAIPIRIGVGSDDDAVRQAAATAFRDRVEAVARGHVHVSVAGPALWGHPGASELELVRAVIGGDPPLALVNSATLSNFSPEVDVLDAPYLFGGREHVLRVLYGPPGRGMLDSLQARGLQGLAFVGSRFRVLVSRQPLPQSGSLAGLRMATIQSATAELFVEALGGEAVPAPLSRVPLMARQGFVDGADIDLCSAATASLVEAGGQVVDTRHAVTADVLIANMRFFQELSSADRLLLWEAALAATGAGEREVEARSTQLQGRLEASGRWRRLGETERADLEARARVARQAVESRIDPSILREIESVRPRPVRR